MRGGRGPSLARIGRRSAALAVLACLLLAGVLEAADPLTITRWVIGGGETGRQAGTYRLNATIGQPVAGVTLSGKLRMHHGYWWPQAPGAPAATATVTSTATDAATQSATTQATQATRTPTAVSTASTTPTGRPTLDPDETPGATPTPTPTDSEHTTYLPRLARS